jgi:lipid II:glycine glycyltransferase (peptidoglycan interpeptide bridge formation enzyme)
MEILERERYGEYEDFVKGHPRGGLMQSHMWHSVKSGWQGEILVIRDEGGKIIGGVSILIRKMPFFGTSMLYAPRGPLCDLHDTEMMSGLKKGVDMLAKKHKAHLYKIDPDIPPGDEQFRSIMKDMGFKMFLGGDGFETVQPRFNYRLYIFGKNEAEILAGMKQKTRYNVRLAAKRGVEVRVMGPEALGDFMRLMSITGHRDGFFVRPKSYFEGMLNSLGEICRLYMAYYNGKAVAGAITTNYAGKACYLYGASDNAHRDVMPTYLIQWEMIRWAIETGCSVYDFQGVSGNLDEGHNLYGLYKFKSGFGGQIDEAAGEFNYYDMPLRAWMIDKAIGLWEWLRSLRRRR